MKRTLAIVLLGLFGFSNPLFAADPAPATQGSAAKGAAPGGPAAVGAASGGMSKEQIAGIAGAIAVLVGAASQSSSGGGGTGTQ